MKSPEEHVHPLDEIRILDLFAGPGGLDVAAHFLGFKSIGIEWDANACETRYAAGLRTIHADVRAMREDRFDEIPTSVDTLIGGPPCQSFSIAGTGAGRRALETVKDFMQRLVHADDEAEIDRELDSFAEDPRTALMLEPLRWLLKAIETEGRDPYKVIVLEQVPAVLPLWQLYAELLRSGEGRLDGLKYEADCWTLRTEEFGVPQTRKRAVLIARLLEKGAIDRPEPTHLPFALNRRDSTKTDESEPLLPETKHRWVSMADALEAASRPKNPHVNGSRFRTAGKMRFFVVSNYGSGGNPRKRGQRQSWEPAFTVTGKVSRNKVYKNPLDYSAGKYDRFTIPESGVLQTFPRNFPWSGKDQAQQVGNAVPPRLGMHVLGMALRNEPPSEEELSAASTWPSVRPEVTGKLRALGCGDGSQCPPDSHKNTDSPPKTT
ncbi:DNA (cytosine-5)-methyltransferase 1 [Nocardiopsis flavescens]|uniref:DNA (cytosine-5-)-methyltransferase n=1 Tax=Nocardiopsis flavescens TaxID=758803 RepID=A0A1M6RU19_9ACTN|nr:DNA cytosine methyltransferase [Nocardiopsis flavescens]SHK35924.1 DNA (cytosine-5)-methyltransferase 1 [Nocardiopsis flavescens]